MTKEENADVRILGWAEYSESAPSHIRSCRRVHTWSYWLLRGRATSGNTVHRRFSAIPLSNIYTRKPCYRRENRAMPLKISIRIEFYN